MNNTNKTEPKSFQPSQLLSHAAALAAASTWLTLRLHQGMHNQGLKALAQGPSGVCSPPRPCSGSLPTAATSWRRVHGCRSPPGSSAITLSFHTIPIPCSFSTSLSASHIGPEDVQLDNYSPNAMSSAAGIPPHQDISTLANFNHIWENPGELGPLLARLQELDEGGLIFSKCTNGFCGHFYALGLLVNHTAWLHFKYLIFAFFFFYLCCLGDLKCVPLFASTTWHYFSTLIQAVPDPQSALRAVMQTPLCTDTWTQIYMSIYRMVHICTNICTTSPSHEYFSKCCCTCLIAGQRQSLGESLLLPK